jgi:DNA-binding MarR family transcriptional regulator
MAASPDDVAGELALEPALDFMRLLWTIEHRLQSTSKLMQSRLGITGPQRLVLRIVGRVPGISAGALARVVRLHPSTITGILQRLIRKGCLLRERDPTDSRRVQLWVHERARPLIRQSAGTIEWAIASALDHVSPQRLRHARSVLSSIATALDSNRMARPRKSKPRRKRSRSTRRLKENIADVSR